MWPLFFACAQLPCSFSASAVRNLALESALAQTLLLQVVTLSHRANSADVLQTIPNIRPHRHRPERTVQHLLP